MKSLLGFVTVTFILCTYAAKAEQREVILGLEENRLSLSVQDTPVRNLLHAIAKARGLDIVLSDSVEGSISLNLDNVLWDQALEVIVSAKGLDKKFIGNVMLVAPEKEFGTRAIYEAEQTKRAELTDPLTSQVIRVHYANANELAEILSSGNTLLSSRGSFFVDSRTNSIVVLDRLNNLKEINRVVRMLDIPVDQVQIEARLVTVSEGDIEELGVRWGVASRSSGIKSGGSLEGLHLQGDNVLLEDMLNVNLGASNPSASGIAFSIGSLEGVLLDLELSALQSESRAEIIASPRLITANKKTAYIEQGTEIPYLEAASSGATSVSFKKAVLSLEVTPQITPDHQIILDLKVTQNSPGETVRTGFGESVSIDTQRIGTQVLVKNGQTVVLGGIYQYDLRTSVDKVPVLGDLPLLGNLFRRSYEVKRKKELLIFVTPQVISEQVM